MHIFKSSLTWFKPTSSVTGKRVYAKSHSVQADGKEALAISAAKVFKGDSALYNPEDLLLSSLMSCHMMSYLYVCERAGVELLS